MMYLGDIMIHARGHHEYMGDVQYIWAFNISRVKGIYQFALPHESCPLNVLMVSLQCTHGIPPMY